MLTDFSFFSFAQGELECIQMNPYLAGNVAGVRGAGLGLSGQVLGGRDGC